VFQFDPQAAPAGRVNYWGYQPVSFFAPHHAFSSTPDPTGVLDEFRDMVKALHRAGLEVILDVVFNHSAEGAHDGPTLSFRGLANDFYYILENDRSRYADYTGCGNTLNANHPLVRRLIQDSLRYWVTEMHVDGFRFDLASILSRDEAGRPLPNAPVLWDIESDPLLAGTKLIAEAWDAAGLYQVGSFVGDAWQEWNGRFRDDVRAFLKGDDGTVLRLSSRLLGSPDIYEHEGREVEQSINFVTCHDGFTLNDVVSYDRKHNEANGEDNRDGSNDNVSWNCGVEGPTTDPAIEALRNRQVKNFLVIELLAAGTPMLLMGDEMRHTQRGNNNAYCQDNEISWLDWSLLERHADVHRFVTLLTAFRRRRGAGAAESLTLSELLNRTRIEWHGVLPGAPDWGTQSHSLAFTLCHERHRMQLYGIFNAYWEPLTFRLPHLTGVSPWRRCVDTALSSPDDIYPWNQAPVHDKTDYVAQPRSAVVLAAALEA
jgi:glycogen operon protein